MKKAFRLNPLNLLISIFIIGMSNNLQAQEGFVGFEFPEGYPENLSKSVRASLDQAIEFQQIENFQKAIEMYEMAIDQMLSEKDILNRSDTTYLVAFLSSRAICNQTIGNEPEAIQDYTLALDYLNGKGSGKVLFLINNRAECKLILEDFYGAIDDCKQGINFFNNLNVQSSFLEDFLKNLHFNKGVAFLKLREPNQAIIDFNKVIFIEPKNATAYLYRGLSKFLNDNKVGACLDLSKAGELGRTDVYEFIKKMCNEE